MKAGSTVEREGFPFSMSSVMPLTFAAAGEMGMPGSTRPDQVSSVPSALKRTAASSTILSTPATRPVVSTSNAEKSRLLLTLELFRR